MTTSTRRRPHIVALRMQVALAFATALSLALSAAAAHASRAIDFQPEGFIEINNVPPGKATFLDERNMFRIICNLTFVGRINGEVVKTTATFLEAQEPNGHGIGAITRAGTNECRESIFGGAARATFLVEERSPFYMNYESFEGMLPAIRRVNFLLLDIKLQFAVFGGITCLYRGAIEYTFYDSRGGQEFNSTAPNLNQLTKERGAEACPRKIENQAILDLSPEITVRLA